MKKFNELKMQLLGELVEDSRLSAKDLSARISASPRNVAMCMLRMRRQKLVDGEKVHTGHQPAFSYSISPRGEQRLQYFRKQNDKD
jgi:transcription initiation factor IIE alpha subunit